MSCNCTDINTCPTEPNCVCGVTLSFYDGCDLTCQLSSGGYIGTYGLYYDFVSQDPSCQSYKLEYNNELNRWELYYEDPNPVIVAALPGPIGCPIGGVDDWVLFDNICDCIIVTFTLNGVTYNQTIQQTGTFNGKPLYDFTLGGINYRIIYAGGWQFFQLNVAIIAGLAGDSNCPFGDWVIINENYSDFNVTNCSTDTKIKTQVIDCGCCDESLEITLYVDGIGVIESTAYVQYDEYGMPIFYNGKLYYEFTFSITDGEDTRVYNYFLYYTGNFWAASLELGGFGDAIMELSPDCPYGYYLSSRDAIFQTFWVRGSKCFDCCDYYTPKNRNLLKKKKAIFVDEISAIRNQEIFGLKCGGSWEDLFRKHLIFDVLNCLPYGVLCEEEEQCLINNLNENCNC